MSKLKPHFLITCLCLLAAGWLPVTAQESSTDPRNQFDFLLGDWQGEYTVNSADGGSQSYTVHWNCTEILDGASLQDKWQVFSLAGELVASGTMFRTWNQQKGHWQFAEILSGNPRIHTMWGEKVEETMVMYETTTVAPYGEVLARRVFSQIDSDSFAWQLDISTDDGATWKEAVATMNPKRIADQ